MLSKGSAFANKGESSFSSVQDASGLLRTNRCMYIRRYNTFCGLFLSSFSWDQSIDMQKNARKETVQGFLLHEAYRHSEVKSLCFASVCLSSKKSKPVGCEVGPRFFPGNRQSKPNLHPRAVSALDLKNIARAVRCMKCARLRNGWSRSQSNHPAPASKASLLCRSEALSPPVSAS